jgi:hypothetical protein
MGCGIGGWTTKKLRLTLSRPLGVPATPVARRCAMSDTLPYIIKARRENRSLVDLINDEYRPRDARGAIWLARSR